VLALSAKTPEALKQLAARYEQFMAEEPDCPFGDLCFTANTGRAHFEHRLSLIATSIHEARDKLAAFSAGKSAEIIQPSHQTLQPSALKIAFLLTGQGSQYVNMGRQLYETQRIFRETLEQCDEVLRSDLETPLLDIL
jgi:acyl transferase domain-containing protein